MTASVITCRGRSAAREVGKAPARNLDSVVPLDRQRTIAIRQPFLTLRQMR